MGKGFMYILKCSDGSFYTGSTKNLERRLREHENMQGANYTKKRLPVKLVYFEEYERIDHAFYREKQIQGWSRNKKISLINGDYKTLHSLAECMNDSHYKLRLLRLRSATSITEKFNMSSVEKTSLSIKADSSLSNKTNSSLSIKANSNLSNKADTSLSSEAETNIKAKTNISTIRKKYIDKVTADE